MSDCAARYVGLSHTSRTDFIQCVEVFQNSLGRRKLDVRVISACLQFYGMRTPHLIGFRSQRAFRRISGNVKKLAL